MSTQKLTKHQAIIITGFTGILCGEMSDFHADVEKRLGRGVQTFEFGIKSFMAELKEIYHDDFTEIATVEPEIQTQKASALEKNRKGGYYIQDLRNPIGNCMKFWYRSGYGTKQEKFFWCATYEEAQKYQGGCDWFRIWYAPYIDSLVEYTVDMQLADRQREKLMIEAAQEEGHE